MQKALCCVSMVIVMIMLLGFPMGIVHAGEYAIPPVETVGFDSPQDNIYFPREIGTTYVYEAETEDELAQNFVTITSDTIWIRGVECNVIHDVEYVYTEACGWLMTEETYDYHAWDNNGNFWYFGEDTIAYKYDEEDCTLIDSSTAGAWNADIPGAEPGIVMLADPMPGMSYRQEYYEEEAEDMGKVLKLNEKVTIDYGDFEDCLKTKEWTPLAPGEVEHKYYAPGVGLVFIEELKGKTVKVELIDKY